MHCVFQWSTSQPQAETKNYWWAQPQLKIMLNEGHQVQNSADKMQVNL